MRTLTSDNSTDESLQNSPSLYVDVLNEQQVLKINYDSEEEEDYWRFTWQITSFEASKMLVQLFFEDPLHVSAHSFDSVSVTITANGLMFDQYGREIAEGFTTNKKQLPRQYSS